MKHPTSELTGYVDGTLTSPERTVVDTHLQQCASCRHEVGVASAAHDVLRALPAVVAPSDIGLEAIAMATRVSSEITPRVRPFPGRRDTGPRPIWARWTAVAGVAAAIVLLAGIVLPNVGPVDEGLSRTSAMGTDMQNTAPASVVEVIDQDLDVEAIQALALGYRDDAGAPESAASAGPPNEIATTDTKTSPSAVAEAVACLGKAFGPLPAPPTRLLQARYQGTLAIIGVVLTGPGADLPVDTVEVFVASREGCTVVSSTRAKL